MFKYKKILASLVLCFWVLSVFPKQVLAAADTIVSVDFDGIRKVDQKALEAVIESRPGTRYSPETLNEDLKRMYALGLLSNIEIEKESSPGGVKLVFKVHEKPVVSKILVQGNKEITREKITAEIVQKVNQTLDEKKVGQSKEKIKEIYAKEGMGLAVVSTEVKSSPANPDDAELIFVITENKELKVKKITFAGNTVFKERKLKGFMKTKEKGFLSFLTGSGKYRDEMIDRDVAFITYQYLNLGYLKAQVEKPDIIPLPNKEGIELRFRIYEGKRYRIKNVDITGDILTTKEELLSKFNSLKGNYYSQKILEDDLQKITELYGNQGYAFANIRPQPLPDDANLEVGINVIIDKGKKITIEKINITGNKITRDKVIRRELKVTENSLYNESLVRQSKQRLEALGYFESVEFSTPKGSSDDRLNLNIQVKEKSTGSFSVGAGYSTVESFIFTASISKQNFLGRGISGALMAEVSKIRQQFQFQFTDPYFLDTQWIYSMNVQKLISSYDNFTRNSLGGEASLGHRFFDYSSASLGYRFEDVKVDDFASLVPQLFRDDASGFTSSLLFNVQRDTRNNRLFATKGSYNIASVEWAGLGGNNHFFRVDANTRWFIPIPIPKNSVLKLNARIGYINSLEDQPVPLFERYFTGGINSLRGYKPRTIGPTLQIPSTTTGPDETFVYGGDKLLLFNAEYEFPIYDPAGFRGVLFIDAGNAYSENQNYEVFNLKSNWGFGLRWISPFGPLRFEWGLPFKPQPGEDKIVFNFTIGSSF